MQIKAVAEQLGLTVEAIRYFEREGLVDAPARSTNGYRSYGVAHIERLRFIANCRKLEMSHDEIRTLIDAARSPDTACETVASVVQHHIEHVEARIAELHALLSMLKSVDAQCLHDSTLRACDVMRVLSAPMGMPPRSSHAHV